jgi:uncharacterized protein (TIRG00374 family)
VEEQPAIAAGEAATQSGDGESMPFFTKRRMIQTAVIVTVLTAAIYFFIPKIADLESAFDKIGDADLFWIGAAIFFEVVAFGTYVALFRGVVGGDVLPLSWREAYEINMAGLAATRLFAAGGAGGIALTYWALRKAGMPRRNSAARMIAFLALQYIWYPLALVTFGVLLRTGVLSGEDAVEVTIIPAAIAGVVLAFGLAVALIPRDFEQRIARFARGHRRTGLARRLATGPATLSQGMRTALDLLSHPSRGGLALAGAIGFWAANIAILWASFKAFGVSVPLGVIVQGFFIGMLANLFPFAPGGVGAVDAGMIGAFLLFGLPEAEVFAAVLVYRVVAFWLPIPPGIIAFFQLRKTIARWEQEGRPVDETDERDLPVAAPA